MPYAIRKYEDGFRVVNTDTGKAASTRPLTHEVAVKQFRLLEMIEHGKEPTRQGPGHDGKP